MTKLNMYMCAIDRRVQNNIHTNDRARARAYYCFHLIVSIFRKNKIIYRYRRNGASTVLSLINSTESVASKMQKLFHNRVYPLWLQTAATCSDTQIAKIDLFLLRSQSNKNRTEESPLVYAILCTLPHSSQCVHVHFNSCEANVRVGATVDNIELVVP